MSKRCREKAHQRWLKAHWPEPEKKPGSIYEALADMHKITEGMVMDSPGQVLADAYNPDRMTMSHLTGLPLEDPATADEMEVVDGQIRRIRPEESQ